MTGRRVSAQKNMTRAGASATSQAFAVTAGTWYDNHSDPSTVAAGYVAWVGVKVQYKGTEYSITDGNTNKQFLWWDIGSSSVFQYSNTPPTLGNSGFGIVINDAGTHIDVWSVGQIIDAYRITTAFLNAMYANIVNITAGSITFTAPNGAKIVIDPVNGIRIYDANPTLWIQFPMAAVGGGAAFFNCIYGLTGPVSIYGKNSAAAGGASCFFDSWEGHALHSVVDASHSVGSMLASIYSQLTGSSDHVEVRADASNQQILLIVGGVTVATINATGLPREVAGADYGWSGGVPTSHPTLEVGECVISQNTNVGDGAMYLWKSDGANIFYWKAFGSMAV